MNDKKYVKGDRDEILKRFGSVSIISLRCPISDNSVSMLKSVMDIALKPYKEKEGFINVPKIDFKKGIMSAATCCYDRNIDAKFLFTINACVETFLNLEFVNVSFTENEDVLYSYTHIDHPKDEDEKVSILKNMYSINELRLNLTDMFDQKVIDMYNKYMIFNGFLNNSYLKREFYTLFDYDGYITFLGMFLNNNSEMINEMDENIIDYFKIFPTFIAEQKPFIRVVTNYSDL